MFALQYSPTVVYQDDIMQMSTDSGKHSSFNDFPLKSTYEKMHLKIVYILGRIAVLLASWFDDWPSKCSLGPEDGH